MKAVKSSAADDVEKWRTRRVKYYERLWLVFDSACLDLEAALSAKGKDKKPTPAEIQELRVYAARFEALAEKAILLSERAGLGSGTTAHAGDTEAAMAGLRGINEVVEARKRAEKKK